MSEPPRRRVSIPTESRESSERRSFFRIAAILGVLVGIPLGVFGLPALLNVFFDEPTIPVNGAYSEGGLTIWVKSYEVDEGQPRVVTVTLALRTAQSWTFDPEGVELEMSQGDPVVLDVSTGSHVIEAGFEARIQLNFVLDEAEEDAEPRALRLLEPKARFKLTESGE